MYPCSDALREILSSQFFVHFWTVQFFCHFLCLIGIAQEMYKNWPVQKWTKNCAKFLVKPNEAMSSPPCLLNLRICIAPSPKATQLPRRVHSEMPRQAMFSRRNIVYLRLNLSPTVIQLPPCVHSELLTEARCKSWWNILGGNYR